MCCKSSLNRVGVDTCSVCVVSLPKFHCSPDGGVNMCHRVAVDSLEGFCAIASSHTLQPLTMFTHIGAAGLAS